MFIDQRRLINDGSSISELENLPFVVSGVCATTATVKNVPLSQGRTRATEILGQGGR